MTHDNIIMLILDEFRYPTHENQKDLVFISYWEGLRGYQELRKRGVEFRRHYTNKTACSPSRGVFYTGRYDNGVDQTSGVAKHHGDPGLTPLPLDMKTMGHHFRKLGYDTIYIGNGI
jgi:arylsulfatase A-like enzyme